MVIPEEQPKEEEKLCMHVCVFLFVCLFMIMHGKMLFDVITCSSYGLVNGINVKDTLETSS